MEETETIHISDHEKDSAPAAHKKEILLNVPLIRQNPELKYGCEVTSLAMVLGYAGVTADKLTLSKEIKFDHDPLVKQDGNIIKWGNPQHGFVGDMTGKEQGYAVYDKPIQDLLEKYMPNRSVNLTGMPFQAVLHHVSSGFPVIVWTTGNYRLPDRPEAWQHGKRIIETPMDLHAVVLVGYDKNHVFINDPLSGKKQVPVPKDTFKASWHALKKRAVSYK
ncbi:C39 family peptidase [Peribacillus deserti]|uniref:Peptidase C39 n=1 Tax=Peribacillus deserti TaxID=673318 RepID=A0A2N5M0Z2_9BACI|nr:C39 family peptidase [Peribacillus deserti]PLT28044.1 peptidase C39 [Peribacillus deserti]